MAYVITGATGHIGNNLTRLLKENDEQVRIIVRKIDESVKDLDVEIIQGSFMDKDLLNDVIHPGDIVIHLAAYLDFHNRNWKMFEDVNIKGTMAVAEISYKNKARKFIFSSSTEALNKPVTGTIIEPASKIDTKKLKSYYSVSKAEATNYLLDFKEKHSDFNLAIVYPGCVIGVNDYKPSQLGKVFIDCLKGKMEFSIYGHYSFVNVKDVCNAIYSIAKLDKRGSYLLTGESHTIEELYDAINLELKNDKKIHKVPLILAYLSMPFVKYITPFALRVIRENDDYRIDKAKAELNYKLTDFNTTVKETLSIFKDHYLS